MKGPEPTVQPVPVDTVQVGALRCIFLRLIPGVIGLVSDVLVAIAATSREGHRLCVGMPSADHGQGADRGGESPQPGHPPPLGPEDDGDRNRCPKARCRELP